MCGHLYTRVLSPGIPWLEDRLSRTAGWTLGKEHAVTD
jgi:hypothetical protein